MPTKQVSDPVIDEVRDVRHRISARFDHDPRRLVAYYQQLQEEFRDRLITRVTTPPTPDSSGGLPNDRVQEPLP